MFFDIEKSSITKWSTPYIYCLRLIDMNEVKSFKERLESINKDSERILSIMKTNSKEVWKNEDIHAIWRNIDNLEFDIQRIKELEPFVTGKRSLI